MKRIMAIVAFLVLTAGVAFAQGKKGYPRMCCDDPTNPTACEWQTCAEMRAGLTPGTPMYLRLLDIDSALGLDLTRLQYTLGGMTNMQLRVMPTVSTLFALDTATANTFETLTLSVPGNTLTPLWLLNTNAVLRFWDEGAGSYWQAHGGDYSADNLVSTDVHGPWTKSVLYGINNVGTVSRLRLDSALSLKVGVYDTDGDGPWNLNATGEGDVDLEMVDGNAVGAGSGATTAGTLRTVLATDSPSVTTTAPAYARLQDGDSTVLGDVLDAVTDDLSKSLNWTATVSVMVGDDGTALDIVKIGASGGMNVEVLNWPNAFDEGSGWANERKAETAVYMPAVTAGTAVDETPTNTVCESTYVLNLPNWSAWVKNAGGGSGDALTDVDVQISYDGTLWFSETSTACDTLASGAGARCYKGTGESAAYVRVNALCGAGDDTTVDCVIQGNKN
jgi:hypothetical protein